MKRQFGTEAPHHQQCSAYPGEHRAGFVWARHHDNHSCAPRSAAAKPVDASRVFQLLMLIAALVFLQALFTSAARAVTTGSTGSKVGSIASKAASLVTVRSRKTHGAAGTFDLVLAATPQNPTTEPRSGGTSGNHSLVFAFGEPVTSGTATVTAGVATAAAPIFNGTEMIVPLSGVANAQYVTVAVNGVNGTASASVRVGFLVGDVNGSRVVTLSDVLLVNAAMAQAVTANNFWLDVNLSGTLTLSDMLTVDANTTQALPSPGTDATPPAGSVVINGGAPYTATPGVSVTLAATDAAGVTAYYVASSSVPPAAGAAGWQSIGTTQTYNGNVPFTLTGTGSQTLYAWFKDAAGNVSATASASILLDQTPPANGSLGASPANAQVALSWSGFADSGSGIASSTYKLVFSTTGYPGSCTGTALYSGASTSFTHTGLANGTAYYYRVCVSDNAGNMATGATATATPSGGVDTTAPVGAITINGGAQYTNSITPTLNLTATDAVGVTGYWLAISGGNPPTGQAVGWTAVTPAPSYSGNVPYTFVFTSDGAKSVYVWYKDAAGNVSAVASASIVLDRTQPNNGSLTAAAGLGTVSLGWSGFSDGGSGLAGTNPYTLVYSTSSMPANCTAGGSVSTLYTGSGTSFNHTSLTAGSVYYYRVCAADKAGNISTGATANATPTANLPPVAKAGPDQTGAVGTAIYFDAAGSFDPDGTIVSYNFAFGDGITLSSGNVGILSHVYSSAGTYTMTVTVTDNLGVTNSDTARVTVVNTAAAQGNFRLAKRFGASSSDSGNGVTVDGAGNVVIVGNFQGSADFGGASPLNSNGGTTDIFIAKYSPSGALLCARAVGGVGDDRAYTVKTDASGNIVIGGSFQGTVDFGGWALTSNGNADAFVAKYAANCGPVQWVRNIGSLTDDMGYGVAVDRSTGDVIVTGYFAGGADFGAGNVLSNGPFGDVFVAKYAGSNGAYLWARTLYGPSIDIGRSAAVDLEGNIIITGSFQTTVSDGSTYQPMMTSAGSVDFFLLKISPSGAFLWARPFGGSGDDVAYGVDVDSGGNIAVVGSFQNSVNLGGGTLASAGLSDTFVARFSPLGHHLWSARIGGAGIDVDYAIAVDALGNVVVTGGYQFQDGQWDILVSKYSAAGSSLWSKSFGSTANDVGFGIAVDAGGGVFVTGYFQGTVNFGTTPLASAGLTDGFLLSLAP